MSSASRTGRLYPQEMFLVLIFTRAMVRSEGNIIFIGIQPLGRFGQRPEFSQATGMALVRCILGKFLGVVCHCFPPCLDVPTFATRCLHVRHNVRDPQRRKVKLWASPVILPKWRLPRHLGIFYMPQIYDMGPTALLPLLRKACWGLFRP